MIFEHDHRITPNHRSREAVVYVRQSSPGQVTSHVESTRIQRGLREKAIYWGWSQPIMVEDDLGVSASGYADRPGFQKMLARVVMREVGIIFCSEATRLSRNSKDWAHLFELCGFFETLIADPEQVYDLSRPNDRLILGIKGAISENELNTLRIRLQAGMEAKAIRGELRINVPAGYVYDASGRIVFDPDQRVQSAITLMFDQFDRCTSVRQFAMWYRDTMTLFPVRRGRRDAPPKWRLPTTSTFRKLLAHPIYTGAYVYGRRASRIDYVDGKLVKRQGKYLPPEECPVFIRDHHPAYISWGRFMVNQNKTAENRPRWRMEENRGAIREGLALLTGLLRCGQCGSKIYVSYKKESALYFCDGGHAKGSRRCQSFGSKLIDQRLSDDLCRALQPLSIEAALAAADQKNRQEAQEIENARMQVQAAQYEADRAFEQFDLVDPKNRLVAGTLEKRLNDRLAELQAAQSKLQSLIQCENRLTEEQRQRLEALAGDFPKVWNHPEASPTLKKRILRAAIHEIIVTHEPEKQRLEVTIHWQGGAHTRIYVKKNATPKGSKTDPDLLNTIRGLSQASLSDAEIARILNMKKMATPRGLPWTQDRVKQFRHHNHIRTVKDPSGVGQMTQNGAAAYLGISRRGLMGLLRLGAISSNQVTDFAPWRVSREELDSDRVQDLVKILKEKGRLPKGGCSNDQLHLFDEKQRT